VTAISFDFGVSSKNSLKVLGIRLAAAKAALTTYSKGLACAARKRSRRASGKAKTSVSPTRIVPADGAVTPAIRLIGG